MGFCPKMKNFRSSSRISSTKSNVRIIYSFFNDISKWSYNRNERDSGIYKGGSPFTSNYLQHDQGLNQWIDVTGNIQNNTILRQTIKNSTLVLTYNFSYKIWKIHGWCENFSNKIYVLVAAKPEKIFHVTLTNDKSTLININWDEPSNICSSITS